MKFLVNKKEYWISDEKIEEFPIERAFINVLYRCYKEKTMGVEIENDAIVIRTHYSNFEKIQEIYNNPHISMMELLQVVEFFDSGSTRDLTQHVNSLLYEDKFKEFKKELKFYGLWLLFTEHGEKMCFVTNTETSEVSGCMIDVKKKEIDIVEIQKRIYKALEKKGLNSNDFVRGLRTIGGYLSGSLVLSCALDEDWNNISDGIDIYANAKQVEGLLCNLGYYLGSDSNQSFSNGDSPLTNSNTIDISETNRYHMTKTKHKNRNIAEIIQKLFAFDIYKIKRNTYSDDNISLCIRFYNRNTKINLILVNNTPQQFISDFDFDFNSIYFDGYSVFAFDWKSILSRKSSNYYRNWNKNLEESKRYLLNKNRIIKYFERGFVITIKRETWEYQNNFSRKTQSLDTFEANNWWEQMHDVSPYIQDIIMNDIE